MVNLNTTRISTTTVGQQGTANLEDIVKVAGESRANGHIRMKADGNGGSVIYGHRSDSKLSFFHKRHSERQEAGTLSVAQSIREFAAGKSPAVQEKATMLLRQYVKGDEVLSHMTNSEVLAIHKQLVAVENAGPQLGIFSKSLPNLDPNNVIGQFGANLGNIDHAFRHAGLWSSTGRSGGMQSHEADQHFGLIAYPELSGGFALAILQKIEANRTVDPEDRRMLSALFAPTGTDNNNRAPGRQFDKIRAHFSEFDKTGDVEGLLGGLCKEIKNGWFQAGSHGDNIRENEFTRRLGGLRSPMFIADEGAIQLLEGFDDKPVDQKLDSLFSAFTLHIQAKVEDTSEGRLMGKNGEYVLEEHRLNPRMNSDTNGELVSKSLDILINLAKLNPGI